MKVDGGQHSEQVVYDSERNEWLERQGFRILRFWNNQVLKEIDGPMLQHGLQELHNHQLIVPARKKDWPDPERLEIRFKEFKLTG